MAAVSVSATIISIGNPASSKCFFAKSPVFLNASPNSAKAPVRQYSAPIFTFAGGGGGVGVGGTGVGVTTITTGVGVGIGVGVGAGGQAVANPRRMDATTNKLTNFVVFMEILLLS
jgi:hypothetical protein